MTSQSISSLLEFYIAIFTLSQKFPKPLPATYLDDSGKVVGRTELERRSNYMRDVMRQFLEGHPMVQMIQQCLKNSIRERPSTQQVMELLEEARAEVEDCEYNVNKLSLVQLLPPHPTTTEKVPQFKRPNECSKGPNQVTIEEEVETLKAENSSLKQSNKVGYLNNGISHHNSSSSLKILYYSWLAKFVTSVHCSKMGINNTLATHSRQ